MKRRLKLISSIFSLTLAMVFMSVGVYAAATRNVSVTGTITFEASNVAATVTISHKLNGGGTLGNLDPTNGQAKFEVTEASQSDKTVQLGSTIFSEATTSYVVTVEIKSDFAASGRDIVISAPTQSALQGTGATALPTGVTVAITGPTLTDGKLEGGSTATYTITYTFAALSAANFSAKSLPGIVFTLTV